MKLTIRPILLSLFLIFFCFSSIHALDEGISESVMDMIPYESLACISVSDLDVVYHSVLELPEWQELLGIEQIAEDLEKANQAIQFLPMLLGITTEEFLDAFGHKMALSLMGMKDNMPVAGLIVDVRLHREKAEYAVEQAATIPALAGGAMIEEKEYRDVPYTVVGNKSIKLSYGFLDGFLLAGINGGFEKLVDLYKDGGKSIKNSPNYQFMGQKVSPSGNIHVYADLEKASPVLERLLKSTSGEKNEKKDFNAVIADIVLKSAKAFALSLSLSGQTNEVYLHLKPEQSDPITDLVLAPQSPMSSVALVPFANGILIGIHIGDPSDLLDKGLKMAESFSAKKDVFEGGINQVGNALGINLRKDLLSTLTGEFTVMIVLPEGQIDTGNKLQMFMQMAKTRHLLLIGVKDEEKLGNTARKLLALANVETMPLKENLYKGAKIHTEVVPLDTLAPGMALVPAYTFKNGTLIMSGSEKWVQDTVDLIESPGSAEIRNKLSESRVLLYLDAGGIARFASKAMGQGIYKKIEIPETIQRKLSDLGSIAVSLSWGSDGLGMKLISASDDSWATKILRGVLVSIYADILSKSDKETPGEIEVPVEGELQKETGDES